MFQKKFQIKKKITNFSKIISNDFLNLKRKIQANE